MNYNPEGNRRRSMRLQQFDYSKQGAYFITICAYHRACLFGKITNDQMVLNQFGIIAQNEWMQSSKIRNEVEMDVFIVMPNHVHGVVFIIEQGDQKQGERPLAPTDYGFKSKSIGSLIAGFKSTVTKQINAIRGMPGAPVWQRNYYDHVIRNEESLNIIREYIINNPITWQNDKLYTI